jgi:hypothetical protein
MNETAQLNFALADMLHGFDPFNAGAGFYDTEIADSIYAVHRLDEIDKLAVAIRSIYEHSFDAPMPGGNPTALAKQLLMIKNDASCSL